MIPPDEIIDPNISNNFPFNNNLNLNYSELFFSTSINLDDSGIYIHDKYPFINFNHKIGEAFTYDDKNITVSINEDNIYFLQFFFILENSNNKILSSQAIMKINDQIPRYKWIFNDIKPNSNIIKSSKLMKIPLKKGDKISLLVRFEMDVDKFKSNTISNFKLFIRNNILMNN